jgi:hypothetical protein
LDSGGYAAFVREMGEFLADGVNSAAFVPGPTAPHRVRDRAPSLIWGCYESVRAYELVLPWADLETLHRLRIATKWLRYALEFFGETLGRDGANLLARSVALQDFLGLLHDADVAAKLARDELVARAGELSRVEAEAAPGPRSRLAGGQRRSLPACPRPRHGSPIGTRWPGGGSALAPRPSTAANNPARGARFGWVRATISIDVNGSFTNW